MILSYMKSFVKNRIIIGFLVFASVNISGCSSYVNGDEGNLKIVASLYPQYDFAKQIAGDKAKVSLLLPPGTESHTFDPGPYDLLDIAKSDIFFYTGKEMEPWADKIISNISSDKLTISDVSSGIDLLAVEHAEHEHDADEDCEKINHEQQHHHHHHKFDPHIWLDPTLAIKMVDNITDVLCNKDPTNSNYYKNNAEIYKEKLSDLDSSFKNMIKAAKRKSMVFADRFAHLYFIKHYQLDFISAFDGCSTESEPSVKRISDIISFIKNNNIPVIYYEDINEPKVAKSISEQTGTKVLKFSSLHNVTKEQFDKNSTYIDLMKENLENLRQGLF